MNINNEYLKQAKLLMRMIPELFKHEIFALKGGTALNFFYRDLPRLSVDIDLTYLKINNRESAFLEIGAELEYFQKQISKIPGLKVQFSQSKGNPIGKLIVLSEETRIKIEPSPIIRGNILPVIRKGLSRKAQDTFELNVEATCLDEREIISSKMVAALDRQHPRDLFDVMSIVSEDGISMEMISLFLIFALQSPRPLNEIISPHRKELGQIYNDHFRGMTFESIDLEILIKTRASLISMIKRAITQAHIDFLISYYELKPNWDLLTDKRIESLPGIKWKLVNLTKISPAKRRKEIDSILNYLDR